MKPTNEEQIRSAAAVLISQAPDLTTERAEALARIVIEATQEPAPKPTELPTSRPVPPRIDSAALSNATPAERARAWAAHTKAMEAWIPVRQSYIEPVSEEAQAAKARLQELQAVADADSDAIKVKRAMEREALMQTIIAGGMARL